MLANPFLNITTYQTPPPSPDPHPPAAPDPHLPTRTRVKYSHKITGASDDVYSEAVHWPFITEPSSVLGEAAADPAGRNTVRTGNRRVDPMS